MKLLVIFNLIFLSDVFSDTVSPVVKLLRNYVQINTTTHSNLAPAVAFWKKLAAAANLPIYVYEYVQGYPVIVIKWPGSDPLLNSVMLNSHMDVVPADDMDRWKYPPFSAHIDENGDVYGRGTQDMKSVAIQQYEALRRLKYKGIPHLRDVYMTIMPDEETGGDFGMKRFIKSKEFIDMRVGVEMDEGWAQPDPGTVTVFAKDKAIWQFRVDCYGIEAHGSLLLPVKTTAVGQCLEFANFMYRLREEQAQLARNHGLTNAGEYTSVNLNALKAGSAANTIPGHVSFLYDVRLASNVDEILFQEQINRWIKASGDNITLTFLVKDVQTPRTVTDVSSPYWNALTAAAAAMNLTLNPIVTTGATDGRHLRAIGIPSFGLSPMLNSPLMAHQVNERINVAVFLRGLFIYEEIVKNLGNIPRRLSP